MTITPKISIVIPSLNQGRFLDTCIQSILKQNYSNLELIIIDGCSTDESVEVIKKYENYLSYWISEPDQGQSDAINKGLKRATGEIVAWLNADDFYLADAFSHVVAAYHAHPEASFYYGDGHRVNESGEFLATFFPTDSPTPFNRAALIYGLNYILQPATFMNHAILKKINYLDVTLKYGMDSDLWIRLSELAAPVFLAEALAASREYQDTKTATGSFARIEELRRIAHKYSEFPMTPGTLCYFLDTLLTLSRKRFDIFPFSYRASIEKFWQETANILDKFGARPNGFPREATMKDSQPLVTIVTPSFNQGRFIKRTIESVLNQTYPNIQYIVMDGGSTDDTKAILHSYQNKFYWVSEPDQGQTHAINKGLKMAKGEIIAYLNSDDVLMPDAVAKIVAYFAENPKCDLVYGNADYIDENDHVIGQYNTTNYSFERLMQDCMICQPATFWRKSIADLAGPFDEKIQYAMDYEYWLRIGSLGGHIQFLPEKLAASRLHDATKTLTARTKIFKDIFSVCKKHGGYVDYHYYIGLWQHNYFEKPDQKYWRFVSYLISYKTMAKCHYLSANLLHEIKRRYKKLMRYFIRKAAAKFEVKFDG